MRYPMPCSLIVLSTMGLLLILSPSPTEAATWSAIGRNSAVKPPARTRSGLGYDAATKQLVLFGGGSGELADTWLFDLVNGTWTQLVTNGRPSQRFSFVYGAANGIFTVATGEGPNGIFYNDVWQFVFATRSWTQLSSSGDPNAPRTRYGSWGGLLHNATSLIVSHGFNRQQLRFDDSFVFDLERKVWRTVAVATGAVIPHKRCLGASAITASGQLLAFGGCGSGGFGPCPSDESWRLDTTTASWTPLQRFCSDAALEGVMAAVPGQPHQALQIGGRQRDRDVHSLAVLDATTGVWLDLPLGHCSTDACPPAALAGAAVASGLDAIYLYTSDGLLWSLGGPFAASAPAISCPPRFDYRTAHGVLMALSWGFLLPIGVTIAHFREHFGGNWFSLHRGIQTLGACLQLAGFIMALQINAIGKFLAVPHAIVGVVMAVIGLQQPLNGYFRAHIEPGQPKSRRRRLWEYLHKGGGYLAVALGLLQPFSGLRYLSGDLNTYVPAANYTLIVYSVWVGVLVTFWLGVTIADRIKIAKHRS